MAPHTELCVTLAWKKHCSLNGGELPYKEYVDSTTLNGFKQFVANLAARALSGDKDAIELCLRQPCEFL